LIETLAKKKQRASKIYNLLVSTYPAGNKCYLYYSAPHELLVASILSKNCPYELVNTVSKNLFNKYHSAKDFAYCNLESLMEDINSINNNTIKADNIKHACLNVVEKHNSVVPHNYDDLVALPGVDYITGKLLISEIYNIPNVVIDTHMSRIMILLGFTRNDNTINIENDIIKIFNKNIWKKLTYLVIEHGRSVCHSIQPNCKVCILNRLCPSSSF
tara:strand:+ start:1166 stop:1813 length:648 start_codon:yes stop_codon:yes gene_type:complete